MQMIADLAKFDKEFRESIAETRKLDKEFRESITETRKSDKEFRESIAETRKLDKEFRDSIAETRKFDKEFRESVRELRKSQKETDRQFKETDQKIKDLGNLFTCQWGKLVEALLGSGLPELFQSRGIRVTEAGPNVEFLDAEGRKAAQVDVMVRNGEEDIAVEVKTTCRPADIAEHIDRLARVRAAKPEYRSGAKKLYGAVASLKFEAESDRHAEKKGFFVLDCGEGAVSIRNHPDFKPKAF